MLNQARDLKSQSLFGKICFGYVVVNNDPLHLGRIKARVETLFPSNIEDENLPWILPVGMVGGVNNQGNINVPDIQSKIWILYTSDDVYSGCYLGSLPNIPQDLLDDYPNTYGRVDRSGNLLLINTEKDIVQFYHVSGTNINIDGSGHTKIQIADYQNPNSNATSTNNQGLDIEIIGDLNLKVSKKISIEAQDFEMKIKNGANYELGSYTCNCSGTMMYNTNSVYNVSAGSAVNLNTNGVISAIGSSGIFGGSGSSFDGHTVGFFQTDISHTPFMAFAPVGTPPSPSVSNVSNVKINAISEPSPRQRQAYSEE